MEEEEAVESGAVVRHLAHFVHDLVVHRQADGEASSGEVVGRVFVPRDQLFRVEQLLVVRPYRVCATRKTTLFSK